MEKFNEFWAETQKVIEDAFNDRSYEEAFMYAVRIKDMVPQKPEFMDKIMTCLSSGFLFGAQVIPIDTVLIQANGQWAPFKNLDITDMPEFYTMMSRVNYLNALSEKCNATDSIAQVATQGLKRVCGEVSLPYAEALVLRAVVLLRSIPSAWDTDYNLKSKIEKENTQLAEDLIDNALEIYKELGVKSTDVFPTYALALKERIVVKREYDLFDPVVMQQDFDVVSNYGIAKNVNNNTCFLTQDIGQRIQNAIESGLIIDALKGLNHLIPPYTNVRGQGAGEALLLFQKSYAYDEINNTAKSRQYLEMARAVDRLTKEINPDQKPLFDEETYDNFFEILDQEVARMDSLSVTNPLRAYEEALLRIGTASYYFWRDDQSDELLYSQSFHQDDPISFTEIIRDHIPFYARSAYYDYDILSRFGLSFLKEDRVNLHIQHPEDHTTSVPTLVAEEAFYYGIFNHYMDNFLERTLKELSSIKDESYFKYHNIAKCHFYLDDCEKAYQNEKKALNILLKESGTGTDADYNAVMLSYKTLAFILTYDLWRSLWLYSGPSLFPTQDFDFLQERLYDRIELLQKKPQKIENVLHQLRTLAKEFNTKAIPYLQQSLPKMEEQERMALWKDYSDWFYSILPYLTFSPGLEGVIYDAQLFSKGLLLESELAYSKGRKMPQFSWRDVQRSLKKNEVAIEFVKVYNCYCASVIDKHSTSPRIIPLFTEKEYEQVVRDETGLELYQNDLGYNLVLAPLQLGEEIEVIYFSASDLLNSIAIESFVDDKGRPVSDKWKLFRLSSTRELAKLAMNPDPDPLDQNKGQNQQNPKITLFGGLNYSVTKNGLVESVNKTVNGDSGTRGKAYKRSQRYGVEPLHWSLAEVSEIHNLHLQNSPKDKNSARLITGVNGVEERVRKEVADHPTIMHFSTHGYCWNDLMSQKHNYVSFITRANPDSLSPAQRAMLYSGLFLSGANRGLSGKAIPESIDDGVLTAAEISNLDFSQTDMVVLSACKTALGRSSTEGVFGLQRGFKLAGANTLLMSLWNVDDEATKDFMVEFYRNLISGQSKTEALKKAQDLMRNSQEFNDPQYWAGWIMLDAIN